MDDSQIVARAYSTWELGTHPYVLGGDDCSAFVSAVLGIPREDTVTLVSKGIIVPVVGVARPGNFLGRCGEGSGGANGHITIITKVDLAGYWVMEQRGGTVGPTEGFYATKDIPDDWAVYMLKEGGDVLNIVRDAATGGIYLSINYSELDHLSQERLDFLLSEGVQSRGDVDVSLFGTVKNPGAGISLTAAEFADELGRRIANG